MQKNPSGTRWDMYRNRLRPVRKWAGKCNFDFSFPCATVRRSHLSKYIDPSQEEGGMLYMWLCAERLACQEYLWNRSEIYEEGEGREKEESHPTMGGGAGKSFVSRD